MIENIICAGVSVSALIAVCCLCYSKGRVDQAKEDEYIYKYKMGGNNDK